MLYLDYTAKKLTTKGMNPSFWGRIPRSLRVLAGEKLPRKEVNNFAAGVAIWVRIWYNIEHQSLER